MSRHSSAWFTSLASSLGHPGYVTLTEVIEAEREELDDGRRGPGEMANSPGSSSAGCDLSPGKQDPHPNLTGTFRPRV